MPKSSPFEMTSPSDSPPEHPLVKFRSRFVALAFVVAVVSVYAGTNLEFDRSIENMYVASEGALLHYQQLKRTFGGNEIVLAVYHDEELFSAGNQGLLRCQQIQKKLAAIPGVKAVLSIDQPLLASSLLRSQVLVERTKRLFQGYTHSADGKTVAIACMLHPEKETSVPRRDTIDGLRQVIQELPSPLSSGHITGEPVLVVDGFRYVEDDGRRLARWSAILLGTTIVVCFRSLRWVLIPILVVQFLLIKYKWCFALNGDSTEHGQFYADGRCDGDCRGDDGSCHRPF